MEIKSYGTAQQITNSQNKSSQPNFNIGDRLSVSVLKALTEGVFLVNIKGTVLNALFQTPPPAGKFIAEIINTEPSVEMKVIQQNIETEDTNNFELRREITSFDKKSILSLISKFDQVNLKELDREHIKKLIKESGLFFEKKLAEGDDVQNDLKFDAYKNSDKDTIDSITKFQILSIISENEFYTLFKSDKFEIDDAEIIIKKSKPISVNIRTKFSQIGDTIINLICSDSNIIANISTEEDISEAVSEIHIEGININWRKLKKDDLNQFDISKSAIEKIGRLEIIA